MDPIEQSQLLAILYTLEPKRCLEWGSGGSTKTLLERCAFVERWVSVEHDAAWHANVAQSVSDPRLTLRLEVPAKPCPTGDQDALIAWCAEAEHERSVLASYVDFPASLGDEPFDFVLVDGRARRFCVQEGFRLLRPGGVLVLHDAQREDYHDALRACGEPLFLEPWKQGQIALLRKAG
jgi:SAM-dependent methyltransferase